MLRICIWLVLLFTLARSLPIYSQPKKNYTDILFEKHFFEHLEAEYIYNHINTFRFFEYASMQPSQLSIGGQKDFTFYKVAQINQNDVSAVYDLVKIAYAQSEFYFSELASYHLANYYFAQKDFKKCLEFIQMTTPFSSNNAEWKSLMYKKAYCLYKSEQYLPAYQLFTSLNTLNPEKETPFGLFYEGYLSFLIANYDNTVAKMKKVENTPPFNEVAPILIVQSYIQKKHTDSVVQYSKTTNFSPQPKDSANFNVWHTTLAYSFFKEKRYQEAVNHFQQLSLEEKDENTLNIRYAYAFSLQATEQYSAAISHLEDIFKYSSTDNALHEESAFLLANLYLKNNQKLSARKFFGSISGTMSDQTKAIQASMQYAKLSLELGYVNDALQTLERLSAMDLPNQKNEIGDLRAQTLALSKDYSTAYQVLSAIENPSENLQRLTPSILYSYGLLLMKTNNYQTADSLLTETQKHRFCSARMRHDIYFWRAEIAITRSQYQEAIALLDKYEDQISEQDNEEQSKRFGYNYGFVYMKAERYEEALPYFKALVAQNRETDLTGENEWIADAMVYLADCHLMLKHYSKAYADYEKVIKLAPRYADYAYFQNCQIVGFQDLKEKERRLDLFSKYYPNSPYLYRVRLEKANITMNEKRYNEAIDVLENLLKSNVHDTSVLTDQTEVLLKLALAYYNNHSHEKASEVYKRILTDYPNTDASKEALRSLKAVAVESNTVDELKVFMEGTTIDVGVDELDSLEFSTVRTLIINEAPKEEIRKATEKYLSKNPTGHYVARANYILAEQFTQEGSWEKALTHYGNVVALTFNDFTEPSYVSMGKIAYFELKDYVRAETYFQKIVEISPNTFHVQDALRGLLRIYYYNKNWGLGYRIAKQIEALPTSTSDDIELTQIIYGKNLQMEKKYQEAIARYQSVPQKSYYYPETQYEIARCYFKMNNMEKAKEVALAITKLNTPNTFFYSKSYFILGEIFMQEKDYFNARATFESLVKHSKSTEIKNEASDKLAEISVLEGM